MSSINPFGRREARTRSELATYRTLSLASYALAVAVSIYYAVHAPHGHGHRIAEQNRRHPTAFSLNMPIVYAYFASLFFAQGTYIGNLCAADHQSQRALAATAVGAHFVANCLLHALFVWLFVASHFVLAELVLVLNFVNLSALYFRHPAAGHPRALVHTPVVAGPLAWTFVALYWNGAILAPYAASLPLRILANVFVWAILAYGLFFVAAFGDYSMGFCLSVLAAALGTGQLLRQVVALQWVFAFITAGVLFATTLAVALPAWTGRPAPALLSRDTERAPLLGEN